MPIMQLYNQRGITIEKGRGAIVWDDNGKEYIDCVGGIAVASIGHGNEEVARSLYEQAIKITTVSGAFGNNTREEFAKLMESILPTGVNNIYLCNSGTEAIEAAIKFSRYSTKKKKIISAVRGFHGRTMGALSATYNPEYKEPFTPLLEGFIHVPYNSTSKLVEAFDDDIAALILEPIQGEGGIIMGEKEYFKKARELCDKHGTILVYDEVQTGFCRTGTMFYTEQLGVNPDILCLGKGIAGGFPMGATVCNDKIMVPKGKHGTTFGGSPLGCAAGIATIDYMLHKKLALEAQRKGRMLIEGLISIRSDKIRDVRGKGLLIGIELKEKAKPYIDELSQKGILTMPTGPRIIRLLPPLVIEDEQVLTVIRAIREVLS
ncbi:MAG: aspartate aminotransferase family protein [Candidatus Woesearchaeota archaeon]